MNTKAVLVFCFFSVGVFSQEVCIQGKENYESNHYKEAIVALSQCLEINQANEQVADWLGKSYAHLKNWEAALAVYKRLVDAYPNNAEYHFLYGGMLGLYAKELNPLQSVRYISDIKTYLKKALHLDPKHIQARWALVQLYMELPFVAGGSKSTAKTYAQQLLAISPVDGHLALGFIEAFEKNWAAAEVHYQQAVNVGQSVTCFEKLIEVQLAQNKILAAKETLAKAYQVTKQEKFELQRQHL